ncbi:unnamed protein product [Ilex paraguariensis]|uniref:Protein kinase domain-containing protein n=1 Tax=Ilex paraguariensis TaxID=185542 RepID=A0ABC8RD25_9AQUA
MWAVGAILAELFTSCPIFPGESEIDQLYKICCVLGTPDWTTFPEARNASSLVNFSYLEIMPANLSDIIPNASLEAIDLIKDCMWIPRPIVDALQPKLNNKLGAKPNLDLSLWDFGTGTDDCFLGLTLAVNPSASNMELVHKAQSTGKDLLFCSSSRQHSQKPGFWSVLPPDNCGSTIPVESSLSLSFSTIPHSSTRVPQSTGFAIASLWS